MRLRRRSFLLGAVLASMTGRSANAAEAPDGRELLDGVEKLLWGRTVQGDYEMSITAPRWQRTLSLKVWMDRPRRSFVRIVAPPKEAGIGSLRIGAEMWNYLPTVERIIKIPPSMMLQPWMGSDFTNDDLVKESSILDDYTHRVVGSEPLDGQGAWQVEAMPRPEAAVVWGRIVYWVRQADSMPLKQEFYSERGELVRVLSFSEVRRVGDRLMPTRWEMRPVAKPGHTTVIVLKEAVFDRPVDDEVFSQRHLQRR
jgi:outer membrane lipoprotein-sorting protein